MLAQVLDVAYLLVGALCTFIGAAGYYMYGNAARDVITFNLPKVCPLHRIEQYLQLMLFSVIGAKVLLGAYIMHGGVGESSATGAHDARPGPAGDAVCIPHPRQPFGQICYHAGPCWDRREHQARSCNTGCAGVRPSASTMCKLHAQAPCTTASKGQCHNVE